LTIFSENPANLIDQSDAAENLEARYQLKEGCYYEYNIDKGYCLQTSEIVSRSKINKSFGRISPNIYVGTLNIGIISTKTNERCGEVNLEVQSIKTSYREDYRFMLEEITEKCHDLLLQYSSPAFQNFEPDYFKDPQTAYQRFAFIKSVLDSDEFNDAIHKILLSPVTRWKEEEIIKDIRSVKRFNSSITKQFASASNRFELPDSHSLKPLLFSVPSKIKLSNKTETVDTPENRFIKYALISFQSLCNDFAIIKSNDRLKNEARLLVDKLEQLLNHSFFKEVSRPTLLPLNSPILQRKEGYREVFRAWLMFNLAAKLIWRGGEDVYHGNKRDVAVLYEYWLFFKLLETIEEVFDIEPESLGELIKSTDDGLGLQLRQGKCLALKGIFESDLRKLNIEFSYNKTFTGENEYPAGGSWTKSMRPDYTLSIWPYGINSEEAEQQELIVHMHFDSKYKIEKLIEIFGNDQENLDDEKKEQRKGTYKRVDLLKMHAYKDAIRRTFGSYILYPGDDPTYNPKGFHEVIPGLGAFAIRPSRTNNGTDELKQFLNEVVHHFMNRASQREKISFKTYETYKGKHSNELNEVIPEAYGPNRNLIPDETFVLIGYYKKETWNWINSNGLYNARAGSARGSLRLGLGETMAKYLLLHTEGEVITNKLFKVTEMGPRIFSKQTLIDKSYPAIPSQEFYLVYSIEGIKEKEFKNKNWDVSKLENYKSGRGSGLPFAITLTGLMKVLTKE
jgi:predicted component of viral defense system (DUF524 family)